MPFQSPKQAFFDENYFYQSGFPLFFRISTYNSPHIPTFAAGYWLFGFASKKYHPIDDLDADAWKALNMRTRYYTTRLHVGAFYLPAFLEEMLREVEEH